MTPAQQARREALAKRVYGMCWPQEAGWPTWCVAHEVAQRRAESVADFIIAEQERREGPLTRALRRIYEGGGRGAEDALATLVDYGRLDAPPQRTVEQVAADLKDWRKMPCTSVDALMDELAAALKRAEGERNAEGAKRGKE